MDSVGTRLKTAREAAGLNISELAEITRIKSQQIEGIERDDFSVVPAVAYGKGFVKLLAQALELDATELVDLYMAQVGAQPTSPRPREARRAAKAVPPPRPAPPPVRKSAAQTAPMPGVTAPRTEPAPREGKAEQRDVPVVERTSADRAQDADTITLPRGPKGRIPAIRIPAWRKPDLAVFKRWPVAAACGLLLIGLLLVPRACQRGRQPDPYAYEDLVEINVPLLTAPETPLFELPEPTP